MDDDYEEEEEEEEEDDTYPRFSAVTGQRPVWKLWRNTNYVIFVSRSPRPVIPPISFPCFARLRVLWTTGGSEKMFSFLSSSSSRLLLSFASPSCTLSARENGERNSEN